MTQLRNSQTSTLKSSHTHNLKPLTHNSFYWRYTGLQILKKRQNKRYLWSNKVPTANHCSTVLQYEWGFRPSAASTVPSTSASAGVTAHNDPPLTTLCHSICRAPHAHTQTHTRTAGVLASPLIQVDFTRRQMLPITSGLSRVGEVERLEFWWSSEGEKKPPECFTVTLPI